MNMHFSSMVVNILVVYMQTQTGQKETGGNSLCWCIWVCRLIYCSLGVDFAEQQSDPSIHLNNHPKVHTETDLLTSRSDSSAACTKPLDQRYSRLTSSKPIHYADTLLASSFTIQCNHREIMHTALFVVAPNDSTMIICFYCSCWVWLTTHSHTESCLATLQNTGWHH